MAWPAHQCIFHLVSTAGAALAGRLGCSTAWQLSMVDSKCSHIFRGSLGAHLALALHAQAIKEYQAWPLISGGCHRLHGQQRLSLSRRRSTAIIRLAQARERGHERQPGNRRC